MVDLHVIRWLGAGISILFGVVQGARLAWEILPSSTQAILLRRAASLAFAAELHMMHLGNTLVSLATSIDNQPGPRPPVPEAEPDPEPTQARRKRSRV